MRCVNCGYEMLRQAIPCPNNIEGCAVYHYINICKSPPCVANKTREKRHNENVGNIMKVAGCSRQLAEYLLKMEERL